VAGAHGSQGTLLSDRAGICDHQVYGGQVEDSCRLQEWIIAHWYYLSMVTCKWFGCCGIAGCLLEMAPEEKSKALGAKPTAGYPASSGE
jgi:hypothetical protein